MKKTILFFTIIFQSFLGYSDCITKDIEILIYSDTISSDSKIIINLFSNFQKIIENYPFNSEFLLSNGFEDYKLNLISIIKGYNQTQIILELPDNLKNDKYDLSIVPKNNFTKGILNSFLLQPFNQHQSIRLLQSFFITNNLKCNDVFIWKEAPELIKSENVMYGCGPSIHSDYKINSSNKNFIYEVTIINTENPNLKMTAFLALEKKNILSIGHGMCYGEFNLSSNTTYKIIIKPYLLKRDMYFEEIQISLKTNERN